MKNLLFAITFFGLIGCSNKGAFKLNENGKTSNQYIPISPLEYEAKVFLYDNNLDSIISYSIKKISSDKEKVFKILPNETTYSVLEKIEVDGSISYGPTNISGKAGVYKVVLDYCKYGTLKLSSKDIKNECVGFAKVGVGVRVSASIKTYEANLDLSSLINIGIAAKRGALSGQISVNIIGIEAKSVTDVLSLPVDISEASILITFQSLATIKSKIYDSSTNLKPQILAILKTDGDCSPLDFLDNSKFDAKPLTFINEDISYIRQDPILVAREGDTESSNTEPESVDDQTIKKLNLTPLINDKTSIISLSSYLNKELMKNNLLNTDSLTQIKSKLSKYIINYVDSIDNKSLEMNDSMLNYIREMNNIDK